MLLDTSAAGEEPLMVLKFSCGPSICHIKNYSTTSLLRGTEIAQFLPPADLTHDMIQGWNSCPVATGSQAALVL
jgi:hypothetical protein